MPEQQLVTRLTAALECRHPVISAGMGGPARAALAAAISAAGGFGLLGMVREPPALIEREIAALRAATERPFGVNLIPFSTAPQLLEDELAVCFNARVPAMCYFWEVYPALIERTKKAGAMVLYQVGSVDDARLAARAGADIVIVQGIEAGGHVKAKLPLASLLPRVLDAIDIPMAASGGIANGRGLAAALAMGADGVHCGTAFLGATESFAHDYHKQRLIAAQPEDTVLTDLFCINWPPHAPVRVLRNSVVEGAGDKLWGHHPDEMPRIAIGEEEGRPIMKFSTDSPLQSMSGDFEQMALYAGQGVGMERTIRPASAILHDMVTDAVDALRRVQQMVRPA
ncbi:nitronate monooxygenase [Dongia mobilis]|uniref:Nitronate monooxygenase n=1 Tax=Dongia mobilis TaxID=578943 RepID=A0A4R6WWE8_9PROT|nr:nitronate monooxygenase [Dongia mobilis]TDQ84520.1 nitronate monooxygenase [Dongia mobilis]